MGMFDTETQLKDAEFAKDGQVFTLHSGEYVGTHHSAQYGDNDKAKVTAGPNQESFIVFGVLAQQIQRMDEGDLPAQVRIVKDGRANVFQQA